MAVGIECGIWNEIFIELNLRRSTIPNYAHVLYQTSVKYETVMEPD
jgi:hypothetical protein